MHEEKVTKRNKGGALAWGGALGRFWRSAGSSEEV